MRPHSQPLATAVPRGLLALAALLAAGLAPRPAGAQPAWGMYAGNSQHTALSAIRSQSMQEVVWQTPVDLFPQYVGSDLYIHYGTPLVTAYNTIVFPVKTGVDDSFRVEARRGADGALKWQFDSDYRLPSHNWTPSYSPALTASGRLYIPAAGGTLLYTDHPDSGAVPAFTRIAFYGITNYDANPSAFGSDVRICTPLTSDAQGNIFFGFKASGSNPLGLVDGLARIGADGVGSYVSAAYATSGDGPQMLMNCAPALSNDGLTVYTAVRRSSGSRGYLLALDAATLATHAEVQPIDPKSGIPASLPNDGTASPMVGPDGTVFFGVLENPSLSNNDRGWLLHFSPSLAPIGPPGAFGWDDTPSLVPARMVPSYAGTSPWLLMTKYNNYAGLGTGDGVNKIAILDPNASQVDSVSGIPVMMEVLTLAGATPDSEEFPTYPGAVREWCINSAAVDSATHSILAGSEDGRLYRWDMATNTYTQVLTLTPGIGEAYTPTVIGADGRIYAINNATLFSVGDAVLAVEARAAAKPVSLAPALPNPFRGGTTLRFSLAAPGRARLDIYDAAGRHVDRVLDASLAAGDHAASWRGRDASGHRCAAGVYFARLAVGADVATRRLVLTP